MSAIDNPFSYAAFGLFLYVRLSHSDGATASKASRGLYFASIIVAIAASLAKATLCETTDGACVVMIGLFPCAVIGEGSCV